MTPAFQSDCLQALSASVNEVATTALDGARFEELGVLEGYGDGYGAYLGLVVEEEPIQVGVVVDEAGCQALAKSLLGMAQAEDDLSAADVGDAMCEVINIVAGGLKRRVGDRVKMVMGLPIFVAGPPLPNQHQQLVGRRLKIGDVRVSVLLLTQKDDAKPSARLSALQTAIATLAKESYS